jgi:hypothetical protein
LLVIFSDTCAFLAGIVFLCNILVTEDTDRNGPQCWQPLDWFLMDGRH